MNCSQRAGEKDNILRKAVNGLKETLKDCCVGSIHDLPFFLSKIFFLGSTGVIRNANDAIKVTLSCSNVLF